MKKLGLSILAVIACVAIIGGVYWAGYTKGTQETKHIVVEGVADPQVSKDGIDFKPFWEALEVIKERFVSRDKAYDNQALLYGAIGGMVDALGDPNTNFLTPSDANEFTEEISGEFSGIGAEIGINENEQLVVIAPLKDTPAYRAGVQAGDRILEIDNESTAGLTVEQAVERIRGERGTQVILLLLRDNMEIKTPITRDIIELPTLEYEMLDGKIAYIRLYNFYEKAPTQFRQAAIQTVGRRAQGIVLDLRNNPGGYLEAATYIGGWFIERGGVIVREEFQDESENKKLTSRGPAALKDVPIVILLNKGSASASEILAGALREQNNATIVGEKSFGKGTVQELVPLLDDSIIKVTIAHWVTPKGTTIDKNGIEPDIALEQPTEEELQNNPDPWLDRALEELKKKL